MGPDPWIGLYPLRGPLERDTLESIEAYLKANAKALSVLHEAVRLDECRFPVDFGDGYYASFIDHTPLYRAAKLLALEALAHTERDQHDAAARSLLACLRSRPYCPSWWEFWWCCSA